MAAQIEPVVLRNKVIFQSDGVVTMEQARRVAEMVLAQPDEPNGWAYDAVAFFLNERGLPALRRDEAAIDEVLLAFGPDRAVRLSGWLARRAEEPGVSHFWERAAQRYRARL